MKKVLKTVAATLSVVMLMGTMAWGRQINFTKAYVDSNTYSYVTNGIKDTTTGNAELYITNLYKADGSTSSYKKVYAKASNIGTPVSAQLGTWCSLSIPSSFQAAGSAVSLYMMGNNPSLDCQASGYWVVY